MRQFDNRHLDQFTDYQQDRIEALKRRVSELETALRFVLQLEPNAKLDNIGDLVQVRHNIGRRRA